MKLALSSRQLVILGLLLAPKRMPLNGAIWKQKRNALRLWFPTWPNALPSSARKTARIKFWILRNEIGQLWRSSQNLFCGSYRSRASSRHITNQYSFRGCRVYSTVTRRLQLSTQNTQQLCGAGGRHRRGPAAGRRDRLRLVSNGYSRFSSTGTIGADATDRTQLSNTHTRTLTYGTGDGSSVRQAMLMGPGPISKQVSG